MISIGNKAVYRGESFVVSAVLADNICIRNEAGHECWVKVGEAFVVVGY
jgi:hypothetical protein